MADKIVMTLEGRNKLQAELDRLIRVDRENVKNEIAEARAQGDLSENAEYNVAKEKQSHLEGRIAELQSIVARAQTIDVTTIKSETIVFGATVNLNDAEKEQKVTYQLVGNEEADFKKGKVSIQSPLGKALIGKKIGDLVTVNAPKGIIEYEIISFKY